MPFYAVLTKVAVLAYKFQHCLAPTRLCDELCRPADTEARRRLHSASSTSLDVQRTRLSTVGDRAFPVAAARLWNSFPSHVTAAPSLSPSSAVILKYLLSLSYAACWLFSHLYSAPAVTRHFGHYNRYYIWHLMTVLFDCWSKCLCCLFYLQCGIYCLFTQAAFCCRSGMRSPTQVNTSRYSYNTLNITFCIIMM